MIRLRRSRDRGHFDHGWLDTYHTFSFGEYFDPGHMGFRPLRVINEDRIVAGRGFGMHPHRDMEIITYVVEGALQHRDSLGHGAVIRPNDIQRITAGTGIRHSEFNPSASEPVHLLQVWIEPWQKGLPPAYEQKTFSDTSRGGLRPLVSPDGRDGSLRIEQDVTLCVAKLAASESLAHAVKPDRHVWLQVLLGEARVDRYVMQSGDGAAVSGEASVSVHAVESCELLIFDLP